MEKICLRGKESLPPPPVLKIASYLAGIKTKMFLRGVLTDTKSRSFGDIIVFLLATVIVGRALIGLYFLNGRVDLLDSHDQKASHEALLDTIVFVSLIIVTFFLAYRNFKSIDRCLLIFPVPDRILFFISLMKTAVPLVCLNIVLFGFFVRGVSSFHFITTAAVQFLWVLICFEWSYRILSQKSVFNKAAIMFLLIFASGIFLSAWLDKNLFLSLMSLFHAGFYQIRHSGRFAGLHADVFFAAVSSAAIFLSFLLYRKIEGRFNPLMAPSRKRSERTREPDVEAKPPNIGGNLDGEPASRFPDPTDDSLPASLSCAGHEPRAPTMGTSPLGFPGVRFSAAIRRTFQSVFRDSPYVHAKKPGLLFFMQKDWRVLSREVAARIVVVSLIASVMFFYGIGLIESGMAVIGSLAAMCTFGYTSIVISMVVALPAVGSEKEMLGFIRNSFDLKAFLWAKALLCFMISAGIGFIHLGWLLFIAKRGGINIPNFGLMAAMNAVQFSLLLSLSGSIVGAFFADLWTKSAERTKNVFFPGLFLHFAVGIILICIVTLVNLLFFVGVGYFMAGMVVLTFVSVALTHTLAKSAAGRLYRKEL